MKIRVIKDSLLGGGLHDGSIERLIGKDFFVYHSQEHGIKEIKVDGLIYELAPEEY